MKQTHAQGRNRNRRQVLKDLGGWTALGVIGASSSTVTAGQLRRPRVAIIIDDLGYTKSAGERALELPGPLTYAVLPHTPHGNRFASRAHATNREVMLHLPMESVGGSALGPGAITSQMTRIEAELTLKQALASVPNVRGVSNHMGSLLSAESVAVRWLMTVVKRWTPELYFVDSRTTPNSVISKIAREAQVPNATRDVFLDHHLTYGDIWTQVQRLIDHAQSHGQAIGIAHPHAETLTVLEAVLPRLDDYGLELSPVSALVSRRT